MNILIIGGTGFLGSYIRHYFKDKHTVDYTYANQVTEKGIKYQAGKDSLGQIISKRYDIVINNINPISLSYSQALACTEDLITFCKYSNSKLIHISSVSALYENRFDNSYNLKKAITEDLIRTEMPSEGFSVLRFTQMFDAKGLSRTSQAGLYYLLKEIKSNNPISIFYNNKECYRNYMPVELAVKMIEIVIDKNLNGVLNAHLDAFTLSFNELFKQLTSLNESYNSKELVSVGDKIGLLYHIAEQNEELTSAIGGENNLMNYFKEAYNQI
ncbi:MAG: NAD(P)-dependent oxidoreductase [Bacteroidota bacterium]